MDLSTAAILTVIFYLLLWVFYRWTLPRPIPGIAHNEKLGILGDLPKLLEWQSRTGEVYSFLTAQCVKLRSPIVQLFPRPLGQPWVVVTDPNVTTEVLMSRLSDFDRSDFFADNLHGILKHHHVRMPTNDQMKTQRRMIADTMSPSFLNVTAAQHIYSAMVDLTKVWATKAEICGPTKAFKADVDVKHAVLDAIWGLTFGTESGTTKAQLEVLKSSASSAVSTSDDSATEFVGFTPPETYTAIDAIGRSVEKILSSPFPKQHHWLLRQIPSTAAMFRTKERLVTKALQETALRAKNDTPLRCAADLIFSRAIKSGQGDINSPIIRDELFGFLVAGHETSATTLAWGLKFLSDNQDIQRKLREAVMEESFDGSDIATEIAKSKIPYLEAFVEEVSRCSNTQPAISRVAVKDTTLMGHIIPAGTDVFFMTNGPGYKSSPIHLVPNQDQSDKSTAELPANDLGTFDPARWLVSGPDGLSRFDATVGHNHTFGAGFRGCFGIKLAYLELRMFFAVMVRTFEFLPADQSLSTYAAVDQLNHHPRQCYVRLRPLSLSE